MKITPHQLMFWFIVGCQSFAFNHTLVDKLLWHIRCVQQPAIIIFRCFQFVSRVIEHYRGIYFVSNSLCLKLQAKIINSFNHFHHLSVFCAVHLNDIVMPLVSGDLFEVTQWTSKTDPKKTEKQKQWTDLFGSVLCVRLKINQRVFIMRPHTVCHTYLTLQHYIFCILWLIFGNRFRP